MMSDLHSLAYASSSQGWDYHNLGVLNTEMPLDIHQYAVMGGNNNIIAPCFSSPPLVVDSDFSSGYLEDALIEFTYKRQRLLPHDNKDHDDEQESMSSRVIELEKGFWNYNPIWQQPDAENFYCMSMMMNEIESNIGGYSDEQISCRRMREEANILAESKGQEEETLIVSASESPDSSSSSFQNPFALSTTTQDSFLNTIDPTITSAGSGDHDDDEKRMMMRSLRRKRVIRRRVVYPFAMVKPGGILREGEVTLNEINERILMPPTRPVRHPVGDFACRPCVNHEIIKGTTTGLSGKAVVALTRIHTQGRRGTITIIRTKG